MYRPPEVFYYCLPLLERKDSWEDVAPEQRCHPSVTSDAPYYVDFSGQRRKENELNGELMPPPYSCEADMYSLGMSFIEILLGRFVFKLDHRLPVFYRQKRLVEKLFKWRQIYVHEPREDAWVSDPLLHDSFGAVLEQHWSETFASGKPTVLCPFPSRQAARDACLHKIPPINKLLSKCAKFSRPPWIVKFFETYKGVLLTMCHPDPDKRPTASSLVSIMSRGHPLKHWQEESKRMIESMPEISSYAFLRVSRTCSSPMHCLRTDPSETAAAERMADDPTVCFSNWLDDRFKLSAPRILSEQQQEDFGVSSANYSRERFNALIT
jgi:serine/threonine protein kinase